MCSAQVSIQEMHRRQLDSCQAVDVGNRRAVLYASAENMLSVRTTEGTHYRASNICRKSVLFCRRCSLLCI